MKKRMLTIAMVAATMAAPMAAQASTPKRGGVMGFIAGCLFGIRSGAAYNDGKEVHWREWIRLVPVAGLVVAVWDGVDSANGWTTKDYAAQYGSVYY